MQKRRFRLLAIIWLATLAGLVLLFPYILFGLTKLIVGSSSSGGAGGAVAAVLGMTVEPLGIIIVLVGIGWVTIKRLRGLNLGGGWSLAVFLWLQSSLAFLVALGNFWGANFGMGLGYLMPPVLLLFLLVFMIFLGFKNNQSADKENQHVASAWIVAAMATAHALILLYLVALQQLTTLPLIGGPLSSFLMPVYKVVGSAGSIISFGLPVMTMVLIDLGLFTLALAFILLREGITGGELMTVDRRSQGRRREDNAGPVPEEFKARQQPALEQPALEPQFALKPVNDMVFWPMVAVCVSLVSFVAIQFVTQDRSAASGPDVVYIDANGQPMSVDQIRKIEASK